MRRIAWLASAALTFAPAASGQWTEEFQGTERPSICVKGGAPRSASPLGEHRGFRYFEIRTEGSADPIHQIVFERGERVCPLFTSEVDRNLVAIEPARVTNTSGGPLLSIADRVSGTGAGRLEAYWLLTAQGPRRLRFETLIAERLRRILPKGYGVWKGSGFDPASLCYAMPVWKAEDGNCCPTGGQVMIQLDVTAAGELRVKRESYQAAMAVDSADWYVCEWPGASPGPVRGRPR